MHPACALCRGACCESIVLPGIPSGEVYRWFLYHGQEISGGVLEFPLPCRHLETCGRCAIHEHRPEPCRTYEVGGLNCRATIARRRPAQAREILALLP